MADGKLFDVPWPAWFYGPDGEARIFEKAEDVPEGWADHPGKLKGTDDGQGQEQTDADEAAEAEEGQVLTPVKRRGRPPKVINADDF